MNDMVMTDVPTGRVAQPVTKDRSVEIAPAEWRFVTGVTVGLLIITTLPYLFATFTAPADKQFMGIMVNVPDHAQYFSWFHQYLTQDLASNTLTPEPNSSIFFNLLWWMLAKLGAWLGLGYAAMFQALRVVVTVAFPVLLYRMCAWFLPDRLMRQTAFLLALLSSGFGWVLIVLKYLLRSDYPLEAQLLIYIVEPNSFFGLLSTPHLIGGALYMWTFDLILRGEAKGQYRFAVAAGLWTLFLGWQHAYDLLLVYGILGLYGLLKLARDRRWPIFLIGSGAIVGALSVWPGLYSFLLTSLDPIWRDVLAQFDNAGVFTPAPWLLPILLGPAFLLATFTLIKDDVFKLAGLADPALFLKAWFIGHCLLIYLPTDYQIKMLNGWQVPIAILATQGLFRYVLPWVGRIPPFHPPIAAHERPMISDRSRGDGGTEGGGWRWRGGILRLGLAAAAIACVVPTNLYLYSWRFVDLARYDRPYFLDRAETAALEWLRDNASPPSVVMASLMTGQYVPALSGQRAFLAHWAQTVDFYRKEQLATEFYAASTSDERRMTIANEYDVAYVFSGPSERALGNFDPSTSELFERVYANGAVDVYRLRRP